MALSRRSFLLGSAATTAALTVGLPVVAVKNCGEILWLHNPYEDEFADFPADPHFEDICMMMNFDAATESAKLGKSSLVLDCESEKLPMEAFAADDWRADFCLPGPATVKVNGIALPECEPVLLPKKILPP